MAGAASDALQIAFDPEAAWQDPDGAVGTIVAADPRRDARGARRRVSAHATPAGWTRWRRADRAAAGAIASVLGAGGLSEPRVAAELGGGLPDGGDAVRRVLDAGARRRDVLPRPASAAAVLSNRGANGIDGTVSSAFGVAAAARGPVVLLIGDVALAHDIGGLLAASGTG